MNSKKFSNSCIKSKRYLILVLLLAGLFLQNPPFTGDANGAAMPARPEPLQTSQAFEQQLKEQYGIELTALRMTAANRMIDFRYRVLDKDKAAPLFKRQIKPYLVHQTSGKVLAVPNTAKVGSLRNSNMPQQGRIYWMFFGNNGLVKNGDKVSVVIGDFRADNLIVE